MVGLIVITCEMSYDCMDYCGGYKNVITVFLWFVKGNKMDGAKGLGSLSSVYSPTKR